MVVVMWCGWVMLASLLACGVVWCDIYVSVLPLVSYRNHLLHSLSSNKIGDEGAKAIGEGLAGSSVTQLKSVAWSGVY